MKLTGNNTDEGELALSTGSCMLMGMKQYQKKNQEIEELQKRAIALQETIEIKNEQISKLEEKCSKLELQRNEQITNNSRLHQGNELLQQKLTMIERTVRHDHSFADIKQANELIDELNKEIEQLQQSDCIYQKTTNDDCKQN